MRPGLDSDRFGRLNSDRIAGPKVDQRKLGLTVVEDQLQSSESGILGGDGLMSHDDPRGVVVWIDPQGEAQGSFATELPLNGFVRLGRMRKVQCKRGCVISVEFRRLARDARLGAFERELPSRLGGRGIRDGRWVSMLEDPFVPSFLASFDFRDEPLVLGGFLGGEQSQCRGGRCAGEVRIQAVFIDVGEISG